MRRFQLLWAGALVNALGSGMTAFGVAAVVFASTGNATAVSAVLASALVPPMLLGPLTGVAADRYDRRLLMAFGDGTGIAGLGLVWWALTRPQSSILLVCVGMFVTGAFASISEPSFKASITDLVSPDDYARSSARMQLIAAARLLVAPFAAGVILEVSSIRTILLIDAATVFVTVACSLAVHRAVPPVTGRPQSAGVQTELREGAEILRSVRGVVVLLKVFVLTTFAAGLAQVLLKPLMLPRISVAAQGILESGAALGLVAGSVVVGAVAARRGNHRTLVTGLWGAGLFLAVLPFGPVWWVGLSGFVFFAFLTFINTGADVLVRSSLPNEAQGRAWGLIGLVSQLGFPVAYVVAGPLADLVFEPLMAPGGALESTLGQVVGVGPGRGIALIFGLAGVLVVLAGFAVHRSSAIAALDGGEIQRKRTGMWSRMLRSDFRRTRTTSIVLAGLIGMASLLAATGGSVLVRLTGAIDGLFDDARTPDVVQMHAGAIEVDGVGAWAADRSDVAAWQVSETLPIPTDILFLGEESQASSVLQPALVTQNQDFDFLLDLESQVLTVQPGEIALPLYYHQTQAVEIGDPVSIRFPNARFDFTVSAFVRDSLMNPTFATSKRLLVSMQDHQIVANHVQEPEYLIEFLVTDPGQTRAVSDSYAESGPATNGPMLDRGTFYLLNAVSHGVGIAVLSLLAILMLAVAGIALRFSFLTAIERDTREIGAMKAIGIPKKGIRKLYLAKYSALALMGGAIGAALSVPAVRVVTSSQRLQLGEADASWWLVWAPVVAAALVVLAVIGWSLFMLRRIGRISTMEALRTASAPQSRRQRRRGRFQLSGTGIRPSLWMGLNDIRRSFRTHRMLLAVLTLCTFLFLVPLNLWTTVTSPSFITYLGTGVADLRLELRTPEAVDQSSQLLAALETAPDVETVGSFVTARFEVANIEGEWEQLIVETGDHDAFPLSYLEGTNPINPDEISVSSLAADSLGVAVGGTVSLRGQTGTRDVTLVGIYQDMTNGGRTAKGVLEVEGERIVWRTVLVDAAEGVAPAALATRLSGEFPAIQTVEMSEFADQTLGDLIRQTGTLAVAAAITAVVLAGLIAAMFAQMVIARDRSQIAIQRGLGVSDRSLRVQYVARFGVVLVAGIAAGTGLVATVGRSLVASIMGQMGAPALRFDVNPVLAYLAVPLTLTATVATVALFATGSFYRFGISLLNEE
ncbi:MAG: MFS transporter [Acidimicrobiia bacterium]|nr:MFS transporter [Acidimicrobiia bacterium]